MRIYDCKINVSKKTTKTSVTVTDTMSGAKLTFDVPVLEKDKQATRWYVITNTVDFLRGRGHEILGISHADGVESDRRFFVIGNDKDQF
jgi:hypothetical protein